jgi:hypothetical protein
LSRRTSPRSGPLLSPGWSLLFPFSFPGIPAYNLWRKIPYIDNAQNKIFHLTSKLTTWTQRWSSRTKTPSALLQPRLANCQKHTDVTTTLHRKFSLLLS